MSKELISYLLFLFKDKKSKLFCILLFKLFMLVFSLTPSYITHQIFDNILPNFDFSKMLITLCFFFFFVIISALLEFTLSKINIKTLTEIRKKSRQNFVSTLLDKDILSVQKFSNGEILYRGNQDISMIINSSFKLFIETPISIFFLSLIIFLLFKINGSLGIITIILIFIESIYNLAISKKYKNKTDIVKESEGRLLEINKQLVDRILFIKLNRLKTFEIDRFMKNYTDMIEHGQTLFLFQAFTKVILNIFIGIRQLFVIAIGAYLIHDEQLTVGLLIAYIQIMQRMASPIETLISLFYTQKELVSSFERVSAFLNQRKSNTEKVIELEDNEVHLICNSIGLKINQKTLIDNVNLKIYKREKIAILGESGSGKSTLCKLIAGIYDYTGKIVINTKKSDNYPYIGFLVDESSLFRGTIKENLLYGWDEAKYLKNDVIIDVLDKVRLKYLVLQPKGLDIEIDKNMLSKGEKQRLELARIMLLKPELIILDEPTSGLDRETEIEVWRNFREHCSNSTIIYTTHDLELIYPTDRILSLEANQLVELSLDKIVTKQNKSLSEVT
ncbi:ABC transporter ATP-binding protein [Brevibacillus thermoruber]|uniref:ATP-binding cassette domain-containing protein n=1 Tax=Brevibacillus thermoruber TaxID=33942 RepID=UPI0005532A7E|nr:ABC transporter ATP-binding protein [Brevibacillus thermoruber]